MKQPFSSAIFNSNHTDLNARSRETERSDRARSNRDAIMKVTTRQFHSVFRTVNSAQCIL